MKICVLNIFIRFEEISRDLLAWSVGFMNFPLFVVLIDLLPMISALLSLYFWIFLYFTKNDLFSYFSKRSQSEDS
jgi:hypothetical protein